MNIKSSRHSNNGFTLIEVLISLFILAVGVLGIIGMQTLSLKNSVKSISRGQAASLSYEIIDRIRANPDQNYDIELESIPAFVNCFSASCTPSSLADFDLAEWKCSFTQFQNLNTCTLFLAVESSTYEQNQIALNGDATVSCTITNNEKLCLVRVYWTENQIYSDTSEQFSYAVTVII